ncbi:MAG TPA: hypothetical protein PLR02_07960 [Rhodocyclaceae bacterium]|nr:hypothetical protein [Rhodocyclaceae bacterium]
MQQNATQAQAGRSDNERLFQGSGWPARQATRSGGLPPAASVEHIVGAIAAVLREQSAAMEGLAASVDEVTQMARDSSAAAGFTASEAATLERAAYSQTEAIPRFRL